MNELQGLDVALFRAANGAHAPFLDLVFLFLTKPPYRALLFAVLAALLIWRGGAKGRRAAITLVFVILVADQLSATLLKPWFDRVRPCFALDEVRLLLPRQARSPSFPSSHATNAFAAAVVLWPVSRALRWAALVLAALVAYSRVYVGVHYPSDILGGAILGATVGYAGLRVAHAVAERIGRRKKENAVEPAETG
ncbi:MAG: phosphatase PAP2 family protein [Candidatus Eisenbacteria bacterium]|nr:phosphatase PAP2 family protein [Candidatus Eisenbacteria bacterium]